MRLYNGLDYRAALKAAAKRKPRARTTITDDIKVKVIKLVRVKSKNRAIAEQLGISEQTVLSIKREQGLTRQYRGRETRKAPRGRSQ